MPTLVVYTNLPKTKIPYDFLSKASSLVSQQVEKSEKYVTVRLHPDAMMTHGGSPAPCASVELYCIGKLGPGLNTNHTIAIGDFIQETLGIPQDRFYVTFFNLPATDVGYKGKTFG